MAIKHLQSRATRDMQDSVHNRYTVTLSPGESFDDLFIPTFWAHHQRLRPLDIVRVVTPDLSLDIDLTVVAVPTGGVVMKLRPTFAGVSGAEAIKAASAAASIGRLTKVPFGRDGHPVVRVEYLPATNWRVLGLNGEVSRDHKSEADAQKALSAYLKAADLEMPSAEEIEAAVKAAEIKSAEAREAMKAARSKGKAA